MRLLTAFLLFVLAGAAAAMAEAPPDPADAPILAAIAAGDLKRAEALTLESVARDEQDPGRSRCAIATRVETLAGSFYATGTAEGVDATERLFARALALRESEPGRDEADLASLLHAWSGLHFNGGEFDRAEGEERRALAILERIFPPGELRTAESRRDLALIFLAEGRLAESAPLLTGAVKAIEAAAPADWSVVAVSRNYLAELYRLQGRQAEAAALLEGLARDAKQKLGEADPQYPYFLNNLAGIYRDQERFDEAETLLRDSLRLRQAAVPPDDGAVARATLNLAELYRAQQKFADAEPLYLEALRLAKRSAGDASSELIEFINQLAVLYRDQGRLAEAEPRFRESLAVAERGLGPNHPRVAQSRFDLAELLRARGRCAEADREYAKALEIREAALGPNHPDVAEVLVARTHCRLSPGNPPQAALDDLARALSILGSSESYPSIRVDALALRADLLRPRDPARARTDLLDAIGIVERNRPHRGGGEGVRANFFGRYQALYERLVRWNVEAGDPAAALAAAERGRARVLLDQLEAAHVGEAAADPALQSRMSAARADLAESRQRLEFERSRTDISARERGERVPALERRLDAAVVALRGLWDEAKNASPAWRRAVETQPATLAQIREGVVPRDGMLLLYEVGGDGGWVFAVSGAARSVEALPLRVASADAAALGVGAGALTDAKLTTILTGPPGLLAGLASPHGSARGIGGLTAPAAPAPIVAQAKLAAMLRVLVPPALWSRIARMPEVLIVPDGALSLLPFEALIVRAGADAASTRYWIDEGPAIRYAPSATFVLQLTERAASRPASAAAHPAALSVSDPDFVPARDGAPAATAAKAQTRAAASAMDLGRLARLPGTAKESDKVRAAFADPDDVTVIAGRAAREPAVRAALAGKRYVHLATHGFIDRAGENLLAGLALTPPPVGAPASGDDDGFLQLYEIYDLPLDCDLAVLSACDSNAGRVVNGEGVFALSRGFLVGGARRVVASQWPVDDLSTAELIGELFRRIADSDQRPEALHIGKALRDAKLSLRRTAAWAEPFFWAPFVLTGIE